ncbi:uncharacterized protein V6R79_008380 [Siganus canaliculatus]
MQPPCSLQLGPCGPSPSLGSQRDSTVPQQLEEKQLFEKFWKGTFKAVATPRPESVIVASITARRRVTNFETTACQTLPTESRKAVDTRVDITDRNGCIRGKGRKHHRHRRARSPSFDEELSPRPKAKKKKRKSERKRKRKRSPSRSVSPLRKKKKKKKKSSKKSKRHRYTSKKSKHSSSSLKHKRRDERKHKKSSRTHSRRRRRYRRSASNSSSCQSSTEDRHHLQKSVVHRSLGDLAAVVEKTNGVLDHTDFKWRPATKSVCKTAPKYRSILSTATILSSQPGSRLLHGKESQHLSSQTNGQHDYDSGNDTSSPPSSKTGVSRASGTDRERNHCKRLDSPERLKFTDRDNISDSGNSVTSYASLCKPFGEDSLSAAIFNGNSKSDILMSLSLQRADNLRLSSRGCEIPKDLQPFTEDEHVVPTATENALIQQQKQEQICREFQILQTFLEKPVAVILQLLLTLTQLLIWPEETRQHHQPQLQRKLLQQSVHQHIVLEQPLHPQSEQKPQQEPQLLLLQELQPQLILELNIWDTQSQQESQFVEQTQQNQALGFSENMNGLSRVSTWQREQKTEYLTRRLHAAC